MGVGKLLQMALGNAAREVQERVSNTASGRGNGVNWYAHYPDVPATPHVVILTTTVSRQGGLQLPAIRSAGALRQRRC